jgi:Putative Flp pilus-assembly TadE/G-like
MRRNKEAGQTLVFVALGMVLLSAVLGLAVDIGYMRFLKRRMQTAADSAAIAAAAEINYGDVAAAAKADAASNGFTDQANGVTVTVNNPPASGPNQGVQGYVEVLISKNQPTFFIRVVPGGAATSTVVARAVGHLGNAKGCIYVLGQAPGMEVHHNGAVSAQNCAILDNGNLTVRNGATITASAIGVGGTVNNSGGSLTPTPQTGMVLASDPLAYLPTQNPGACNFTNFNINSGNAILNQGVYCGGITITGSASATFNPGLYIMTSGGGPPSVGLLISSSGTVTGSGVTIYNAASSGPITITSTGTVSFSASTSGTYAGVLMFQDPANASPAIVNGGNNPMFAGALYFPNLSANLSITNIGSGASGTTIVAGSLDVRGNTNNFNSAYSLFSSGSPIKNAVLAE